ncbi:PIN domain-containing protein [Mucilaginibacter sp. CSA2-8R]|uniref:type II toxin-antitoxin system VapC family toxin n=1 Tax=Mucilaginibacter sp. CSA2-8R TaxID=3141542 RepID=UPI00315C9411
MGYKKAFIDSDVLLDLLLEREPFVHYTSVLLDISTDKITLCTSTLIIANIYYIAAKSINKSFAQQSIQQLTKLLPLLSFEARHVMSAINKDSTDFEDAIQYYIANQNNCDVIISSNLRHYKNFDIPVLTAEQFLKETL